MQKTTGGSVGVGVGRVSGILSPPQGGFVLHVHTSGLFGAHYLTIFRCQGYSLFVHPHDKYGCVQRGRECPSDHTQGTCLSVEKLGKEPCFFQCYTAHTLTHTPAALSTSSPTAVGFSRQVHCSGASITKGLLTDFQGIYSGAACCWRGGSTMCQSLAYMSSCPQSMVFAV